MDIVNSKNLIIAMFLVNWVAGQVLPGQGVHKKIKFPEYDRKSGKITSLLTGDKAVPYDNGLILVEGARVETYKYEGTERNVDLIIEAPTCFFDLRNRVASSAGHMRVYRSDEQAVLEGKGFWWRHNPDFLVISNNVKTVMSQGFTINEK